MCSRCLHIETWVPGGEYKRGVRALRKAIWVGKNVKLIGCGGRGEGKTRENIWVNLDFCGMWSSLTFLMVRWPPMQHRKLHFKELREGRRRLIFVLHCPVSNCRGEWPKMPTANLIKPTRRREATSFGPEQCLLANVWGQGHEMVPALAVLGMDMSLGRT